MSAGNDKRPPQGPPKDVDASDLWSLLTTLPTPHRIVDHPRKLPNSNESVGQIAIIPLTQQETINAQIAAEIYTRDVLKDRKSGKPLGKDDAITPGYDSIFKNEAAAQVLYRACRRPNDLTRPVFPAPQLLKDKLTADEIGVLVNEFNITRVRCGPIVSLMTTEEKDAWLDALEAGGEAIAPFASLSSDLSLELLMHSVARTRSLRKASSSPGGPLDDPSSGLPTSSSSESGSTTSPEVPVSEDDEPVAVDEPPVVKP